MAAAGVVGALFSGNLELVGLVLAVATPLGLLVFWQWRTAGNIVNRVLICASFVAGIACAVAIWWR